MIVVGSGLAGLCAALSSAESGAHVLLLEAAATLGGSTRGLGGVIYAAGTSVQASRGLEDDPAALFEHYMVLNQYRLEPRLLRVLCEAAPGALDWLADHGVSFPATDLYSAFPGEVPRSHRAAGRGPGLVDPLAERLSAAGVVQVTGARVRDLTVVDDLVVGVSTADRAWRSKAVVLATGGFGASPDLIQELYPTAAALGPDLRFVGEPTARGDGISMARTLGAQLAGRNRGLLLLAPPHAQTNEPVLPPELVLVDTAGQRFMSEDLSYALTPGIVDAQPEGWCWAVFDDAVRRSLPSTVTGKGASAWHPDTIERLAGTGDVLSADSLASLANLASIEPEALGTTVADYNSGCAAGEDRLFEKGADHLKEVRTPPFYAVRLYPRILVLTSGGVRIDDSARVLAASGAPIPGLFAAGETAGGIMGERYVGGLVNTASAVFGLAAGRSAARGRSNA